MTTPTLLDRITIDPQIRRGKPVIRGTRIAVSDILQYLAGGATDKQLPDDFPDLSAGDIRAVLAFAESDGASSFRVLD